MALVIPGRVPPARGNGELHPVVGLLMGFGLIVLAAVAVHLLFSVI